MDDKLSFLKMKLTEFEISLASFINQVPLWARTLHSVSSFEPPASSFSFLWRADKFGMTCSPSNSKYTSTARSQLFCNWTLAVLRFLLLAFGIRQSPEGLSKEVGLRTKHSNWACRARVLKVNRMITRVLMKKLFRIKSIIFKLFRPAFAKWNPRVLDSLVSWSSKKHFPFGGI